MSDEGTIFWHVYHCQMGAEDDETDTDEIELTLKLVGFYSSLQKAEEAVERMRKLPGFRDWPDGFRIYQGGLDGTNWTEGFGIDF
ncbi:MAG: hypothetical protein DI601_01635 [Azospirillum brasilense]|nr:hypothetical protein [Roseomonas gilardii]PZP48151.1 MAG: hypothetical protein DI601_01635 [Azospirillum brasilense]